jgi:hypothetical protein
MPHLAYYSQLGTAELSLPFSCQPLGFVQSDNLQNR